MGTFPQGINAAGQIVGSYQDGSSGNHGFLLMISPNAPPPVGTTADMILRGSNTSPAVMGQYEIYDIGNNAILAAYPLVQVGTDWQFAGLGGFQAGDTTDMFLRRGDPTSPTAGFLDGQVQGFGNFSSRGENDMMLREGPGFKFPLGNVALNWQIGGFGNFSGKTGATFLGTVGLEWQFAGVAPISGAGRSDLVLRNVNTGAFEVYDIANNSNHGSRAIGLGRIGVAARRLRGRSPDRLHGQLGLNLSTRASDGVLAVAAARPTD